MHKDPNEQVDSPSNDPNDVLLATPALAATGNAVSLLFQDCALRLQGPADPLADVKTIALRIPPLPNLENSQVASLEIDLVGAIHKDAGAHVTVHAELGGKKQTLEFPYEKEQDETFQSGLFRLERIALEKGESVPPLTGSRVCTVVLIAERRSIQDTVQISLESLDFYGLSDKPDSSRSRQHRSRRRRQ